MQIQFTKTLLVGKRCYVPGEVGDIHEEKCKQLIKEGHAVPYVPPVVQATIDPHADAHTPEPMVVKARRRKKVSKD